MAKKIYCAVIADKVVAAHESVDAVQLYCSYLEKEGKTKPDIGKLKNTKTRDISDIYLVRYGDNYIPYKYYEILRKQDDQIRYDLKYAKDILLRSMEDEDDEIPRKHIRKVILFLEKQIDDIESSIPSINTLENMVELEEEYLRKMRI